MLGNSCVLCLHSCSFAVLAQPAVAQGANTTFPLTYPGQVLQGDSSQICPSEEQAYNPAGQFIILLNAVKGLNPAVTYACSLSVSSLTAQQKFPTPWLVTML